MSQLQLHHASPAGGTVEHCLILTGRTAQRDAELSTGGEGEVETWEGTEKHTSVIIEICHTTNGKNILIVKGLLLIDYNMSSCAVVL